jgi:hypothetical protein
MSNSAPRPKRFLDGKVLILKLTRMKNLKTLGVLVVMCGSLGSCGIPMSAVRSAQTMIKSVPPATVRTVQNASKAIVSTASDPFGPS